MIAASVLSRPVNKPDSAIIYGIIELKVKIAIVFVAVSTASSVNQKLSLAASVALFVIENMQIESKLVQIV